MKRIKGTMGVVAMACLIVMACQESKKKQEQPQKENTMAHEKQNQELLRHVVIFKFNENASAADVQKLNDAFNALPTHISAIKDFEWGLNDSPENFHQGFTHCYMLTFHSEHDRDRVYTPHPKHQEFVASLQPFVEKVFVVDYWAK